VKSINDPTHAGAVDVKDTTGEGLIVITCVVLLVLPFNVLVVVRTIVLAPDVA